MKAKVAFGEDIRRWHYPSEHRFNNLTSFVEKTFLNGDSKRAYFLQFEDLEMDKVTMCNEQDLLDAFECAEQEKRQSLKIFVVAGSVTDTHELSTDLARNDLKTSELEKEPEQRDWQEVMLEFVLDENVRKLLPELIRTVVTKLREKKKSGEEPSLAEVVPVVLKENKLEGIVDHKLYKSHIESLVPMLLASASCFTHVLLALSEEEVEIWVSDMLKLISVSFSEGKDNGLWKMHVDMWREEESNGGEAIHHKVQCDMCGVTPIRGIRYKCAVCSDYDLCEKCEASGEHPVGHALLKMTRPMCGRRSEKRGFSGLREIIGKRPCHGRRYGSCPRPCWTSSACENNSMCSAGEKQKEKKCKKEKKMEKTQEKKLEKTLKKQQKLKNKLEKIKSKLDDSKTETKVNLSMQIPCVCGASLVEMTQMDAYGRAQVICDGCEMNCSEETSIFHCLKESSKHPCGFDLCLRCASKHEQLASSSSEDSNEVEREIEREIEMKNEREIEKEKASVEKKVESVEKVDKKEPPQEKEVVVEDPFDQFPYAQEARNLVEMGFTDKERIMYLLVNKKGDLLQVIPELLPQ
jgi:hypothetical protein